MENDLAAVKKFVYMIEGHNYDNVFTVFNPELPAVSLESAQVLCEKWHTIHPDIVYVPVLFFKMDTC